MPFQCEIQPEKRLIAFRLFGEITTPEIEAYSLLRIHFPKLESPVVIYVDSQDTEGGEPEVSLEKMEKFCKGIADRYEGTGEVLALVSLANSERMFGYARMLKTYVGTEYPIHVFLDRAEAEACIQTYLA